MNDSAQSYKKSVIPLFLEVKPSRTFQGISLMLHGASIFAMTQTTLEPVWVILMIGCILISAYFSHILGNRTYRLQWRANRSWEVRFSSGEKRTGRMLAGTTFNPFVIILALRTGESRKDYIMIPRDSIPTEDYIQLQARLRVEADKAIASQEY